jgi:N-acetylmuramoyl-L-alanine amidase
LTRALTSRLLAILLAMAASSSFARAAEGLRLNGREYLRLTEWAKANHLEVAWLKREETLQLSNASSKLQLTVDSREAQLNGVQLLLSFPVVQREGKLFLARSDTQSTLQPLLVSPKNPRGALLKSVCLDPGHGGKDPGNQAGSNQEKKYTLLLAQELRKQLDRAGFKVMLTRTGDSFIELPDRPALANRKGADLFVSLHFNSSDASQNSVRGAEVYCVTPPGAPSSNAQGEGGAAAACPGNRNNDKNTFLAYQIQKALTHSLAVEDRGVRRARFAVLRDATMPAVLIEAGFMSHPAESRKIFDAAYRRQIAQAIVEGILAYKRQVEVK